MFRPSSTELSRCFGIIFMGETVANHSFSLVLFVFVVVAVFIVVFRMAITASANLRPGFPSSKPSKALHWFPNQALTSLVLVKGSSLRLPGYLSLFLPPFLEVPVGDQATLPFTPSVSQEAGFTHT